MQFVCADEKKNSLHFFDAPMAKRLASSLLFMHLDDVGSCVVAHQCNLTNSNAEKLLDMASSNVMNSD